MAKKAVEAPAAAPSGQAGEIPDGASLVATPSALSTKRYLARWPIEYNGREYDRGALIRLAGLPNDERLVRLGYLAEFTGKRGSECGACGTEFASEDFRAMHGNRRHRDRFETRDPHEEDAAAEREERMLREAAPLHLDRTAAARA